LLTQAKSANSFLLPITGLDGQVHVQRPEHVPAVRRGLVLPGRSLSCPARAGMLLLFCLAVYAVAQCLAIVVARANGVASLAFANGVATVSYMSFERTKDGLAACKLMRTF